jgi:hypothetical protein
VEGTLVVIARTVVIAGLDPAIHRFELTLGFTMEARVKPRMTSHINYYSHVGMLVARMRSRS